MTDTKKSIETIYERYDRENESTVPDVQKTGSTYLSETAEFTRGQSDILAQIIVSFVDDTARRHKRYFDSPSAGADAERDAAEELRYAGKPDSFLHRLLRWLLGRGDDFMEQLKPYLDERQIEEIGGLFDKEAQVEPVSVAEAQDLLRGRTLLTQGNLAKEMEAVLDSDDPLDDAKMPKCLKSAFSTDLLSKEETAAIKLLAFDLLDERVLKDEESRKAAPLCALFAAKASYDLIVSLKATIRTTQLDMLSEDLNLDGRVDGEAR